MNDGGSVPGGSQSTSGGSGVSFLNHPKKSDSSENPSPAPIRAHILGQEISGIVDTPAPKPPTEPLLDTTRPVLDLSSILDEPTPPSPAAPQPQQPTPPPEPETESTPLAETLPSDSPKKSQKTIIITSIVAGVAILLIAIIAIVIFMLSRPQELTPVETAFNTFSNNLIYGKPSAESLGSLPAASDFYYHQKLSGDSGSDQTYLDQLSQEFDTFYGLLSPNLPVYASASNYQQLLNFLKLDPSGNRYNRDALTSTYIDGGESSVSSYIKKTLATLPETNPYAAEFRALKQNEFSATLDYLIILDNSGCIDFDTKTVDDYCANSVDRTMQDDPEQFYYRDRVGDEPASYFQDNLEDSDDSSTSDGTSDSNESSDSDKSSTSNDSSVLYRTPYTVMHDNADLAKNLLNTDINLLGENFPALKNAFSSSK